MDDTETDQVRGFTAFVAHADKTMEILKAQLQERGIQPAEYIPLPELKAEIELLAEAINAGRLYDEKRYEHLMRCLERNPEYQQEQAVVALGWREEVLPFCAECLQTQRAFIPGSVFRSSTENLIEMGLSKELALRCDELDRIPLTR